MQERHIDRDKYFDEQAISTKEFVIPYIQKVKDVNKDSIILEE